MPPESTRSACRRRTNWSFDLVSLERPGLLCPRTGFELGVDGTSCIVMTPRNYPLPGEDNDAEILAGVSAVLARQHLERFHEYKCEHCSDHDRLANLA
jgi:hypothetical protein